MWRSSTWHFYSNVCVPVSRPSNIFRPQNFLVHASNIKLLSVMCMLYSTRILHNSDPSPGASFSYLKSRMRPAGHVLSTKHNNMQAAIFLISSNVNLTSQCHFWEGESWENPSDETLIPLNSANKTARPGHNVPDRVHRTCRGRQRNPRMSKHASDRPRVGRGKNNVFDQVVLSSGELEEPETCLGRLVHHCWECYKTRWMPHSA